MNLLCGAEILCPLSELESPYYGVFFFKKNIWEESVLERCPYWEVRLYSFLPLINMWKVWMQESFQK